MRKFLLSILVTLSIIFMFSCDNSEKTTTDSEEVVGEVVINDFETYTPDFTLLRVSSTFGSVDINFDQNYVKTGNASALLRPLGGYYSTSTPLCYYPLYSEKYDFDYRDLTKIKNFSFEAYNDSNEDLTIRYGLVMEAVNTDLVNKSNPVSMDLKPGWNTITYNVDLNVLNILYDVTKCEGFYFSFDRAGSQNIDDAPRIYIDDLKAFFNDHPQEIDNLLTLDTDEICNFDKLYQNYVLYTECENPSCEPKMEVIDASKVGVDATSGKKVLKVTFYPGEINWGSWQRIIIPEKLMQLSSMKEVDEDDYENTYFCFDVYLLSGHALDFYPEFFDRGYGTCYNKWAVSTQEGKWITCKIKLSELTNKMVTNPGFFRLAWAEFSPSNGEVICLFDSFRIERS